MGKKIKYVNEGYVQDIENYIYNDIPVLSHQYYSDSQDKRNLELIKPLIRPNEEFVQLKDNLDSLIVTSFGRIINIETVRQLKLMLYKGSINLYKSGEKVKIKEVFEENGWEYDVKKILKIYDKHGWGYNRWVPE